MTVPDDPGRAPALKLLEQVETLLKEPRFGADFSSHGINTSVALVALQGLMAYLEGNKARAAEDLITAGEEIRGRMRFE